MNYYLDTEFLEGPQKDFLERNKNAIKISFIVIGFTVLFYMVSHEDDIGVLAGLLWLLTAALFERYKSKSKPTIDLISIGIVAEDGREGYWISKDFNLKEAWNRWQPRTGQGDRNNLEPKEYWIRENVLRPIWYDLESKERLNNPIKEGEYTMYTSPEGARNFISALHQYSSVPYKRLKYLIKKYGKSNEQIAEEIRRFIYPCAVDGRLEKTPMRDYRDIVENQEPIFYGYFADYDHVVFCWLFGYMIDLPKGFPKYTRDLKQMLDEKVENGLIFSKRLKFDILNTTTEKISFEEKLRRIKDHPDYPKQSSEHSAIHDARWNKELHKFIQKL